MSNVVTFPGTRPPSNIRELRNPSYQLPTENVVDSTPGKARRHRRQQSELQTETGKNAKIRRQRREAWWQSERRVEYWKACMKMHSAIRSAQLAGLPEGDNHQTAENWHWHPIIDSYRKAIAELLLTPASTLLNVAWKQKALAAEEHKYTDLSSERVEAAIARDLEFLTAHPTRRKPAG
ncbi:hypothetical protein M2232_003035 [Bradyrhizobium japonicum]|uniref:hypothetical protein n=1 Tax=Bradyrhizobium japonicum TaxID=375 RepID=UPI002226D924|nr:hypothetical protein [Bradyrhizobium japonicum]MCW2219503.1 hypothetical protein [Bradyrhizobium japonicum]MCW2344117.1 hypothetical protein [Bradyrhizobium japonicum]